MHKTEGQNLTSIVRNTLMGASMIGTAYTISNGLLRLPGVIESDATAAGVAFATDAVVTLAAMRLGDLDARIHRAQKRQAAKNKREATHASAEITDLSRKRAQTLQAFCVAGAISIICNVYYNYATKHSLTLALLVGVVPIVMVAIVAIVLRPLPVDYEDLAKSQTKEALIDMVAIAGAKVRRTLKTGRGTEELPGHLAILGMYSEAAESYGLQQAMKHTGAVVDAERVTSDRMLSSAMIVSEWGRSLRTVQNHMAQMPECQEIQGVRMVPESAYRARFGDPMIQLVAPRKPRRNAKLDAMEAQIRAHTTPRSADGTQLNEIGTLSGEIGTQLNEFGTQLFGMSSAE